MLKHIDHSRLQTHLSFSYFRKINLSTIRWVWGQKILAEFGLCSIRREHVIGLIIDIQPSAGDTELSTNDLASPGVTIV